MVLFIVKNNILVTTGENKFVVFDSKEKKVTEVHLPPIKIPDNLTKNQIEALNNEKVNISTCAFSNCGDFFVVSTTNKQLVVYNNNFEVLHNLNVNRTASKIRFTNSSLDLVVADKTGDVYLYKLKTSEVVQVLGHLSMVLDVLTTKDDKFIITADRDEKIRVSHFPNAYNIVSFCLGHEEFVSNIELFHENTLISASGDGTLRFWDFNGKSLNTLNVNDFIDDKNIISTFSEQMDKETVEINALPITFMKIKTFDNYTLIICALHLYNGLLIFKAFDLNNIELLQKISFNSTILAFDLSEKLYVLLKDGFECFDFDNTFVKVESSTNLNEMYNIVKNDIDNVCLKENISVLYKRKFDNVQEYQERKKLRIEGKK